MANLSTAKTLGEIGSILELIPFVNIVGYILTLISVKYISDELQDQSVFNNMLYSVITGIVGVAVGFFILLGGMASAMFTGGLSAVAGVVVFLSIPWIVLMVSAIFVRRAFETMATKLNVDSFRTAGTLYLIGAALTIVFFVGFIILFVAYIFQIISFFAIKDTVSSTQVPGRTAVPTQPQGAMKYCTSCGAQMSVTSTFCPSCGAKQS
ncbi:MAG TPA: DUF996 domain-containing protein [Nitrososphaerales archaeon]|nr:DUF996 domain-containing protein [Nitrososphaerales archaeon]